jgi:hypothetical protein
MTPLGAYLVALWPKIELCTGRIYAQRQRKRRSLIWLIVSFGVLPILAALAYDIIKLVVGL